MKFLIVTFYVTALSLCIFGQNIKLTGTVYDPNGAIVVGAEVNAISAEKRQSSTKSKDDGIFLLDLVPGIYRLEFYSPGFKTNAVNKYHIVNSTYGKMSFDVVLHVSTEHEPCGYSGGDCITVAVQKSEVSILSNKIPTQPKIKKIKKGNKTIKKEKKDKPNK